MSLWMVRAGKNGEQEQAALEKNAVTIGWNELPDLTKLKSADDVKAELLKINSTASAGYLNNVGGQIYRFAKEISKGDLVVLPLKSRAAIAIGQVTGDYEYHSDPSSLIRHARPVKWIRTDIPRNAFDQDLLYSFGAFMTVCRIQRNDAEKRVNAVLAGKFSSITSTSEEEVQEQNLEEIARDQIVSLISRKFKGHELTRLVDGILQAQGFKTYRSPPGPDGGIDILASSGTMGFDSPKILVQVKSSDSQCDTTVYSTLLGTMSKVKADSGLLVSWGGFNSSLLKEARTNFFSLRLWDSGDLVEALIANYPKLNAELQAEIPLKQVHVLVMEEE